MDVEHFLLTGSSYTPLKIYFAEDVWVGGHSEIVRTSIWKNPDPEGLGAVNWNGTYRFCLTGTDTNNEALAEIPAETWEKMKTEKFYVNFTDVNGWYQLRIATGWWNYQWPYGKDQDITPEFHPEMVVANEDGTFTIEIDLTDTDLAANMDVEHFLLTGSSYTPLEIYFQEEIWVDGGGGPKEVLIWENDDPEGHGVVNWNGVYRFCLVETDTNNEALTEIPAETWDKMKTQPFYVNFTDVNGWYQVRIATGWWNYQWPYGKDQDITPEFHPEMVEANEDGTFTIGIDLKDTDLAANMDVEHFLLTGASYTPLKMYFLE